jgi:hypothetical protein
MEISRITQSGDTDLERSFFYPKPRVLVTWNPSGVDQLRMRVEREVGQLDFGDFIASADLTAGSQDGADANLEPQRSWVGEVAWERRFWGAGSISATLTHSEISDVVDYKPLPAGGDAPSNIGDGRSDQFVIALTLPTQKLGVSGGQVKARLSWFDSEVTDPVTFEKAPYHQRHAVRLQHQLHARHARRQMELGGLDQLREREQPLPRQRGPHLPLRAVFRGLRRMEAPPGPDGAHHPVELDLAQRHARADDLQGLARRQRGRPRRVPLAAVRSLPLHPGPQAAGLGRGYLLTILMIRLDDGRPDRPLPGA